MNEVIIVKLIILSIVWFYGCLIYMIRNNKPGNLKNTAIVIAPLILWFLYFMLFWWG